VRESSIEDLITAIGVLEEHQMVPTYETLKCVIQQQTCQIVEPLVLPCEVRVDELDLSVYDNLMGA